LVDPVIIPLSTMTLSLFLRSVTSRFIKGSPRSKKRIAGDFLTDRLKDKVVGRLGKRALQEPLTKEDLPVLRELISEELKAYGATQKEIDQLITTSLARLAEDHTEILSRLDDMEQLVRKVTLPLALKVAGGDEDLPMDLLEELMAQKLLGNPSSERVFDEMVEEKQINGEMSSTLANFSFLTAVRDYEQKRVRDYLSKNKMPEDLNELLNYLTISDMLSADTDEECKTILDDLIGQLLVDLGDRITGGPSLRPMLHILDRLNRLTQLSETRKHQLRGILTLELRDADDTEKLELLYLMARVDPKFRVDPELVEGILDRLTKTGISDAALKKKKVSFSHRVLRFLRRRKRSSAKSRKRTIRNLKSLTRRLERRKFARATPLMHFQLERLIAELSLLIVDFEGQTEYGHGVAELDELLRTLIDVLQRPATKKLNAHSRLLILESLDHVLYLQDLIGLTNGLKFAVEGQETINALYTSSLGRYRRSNPDVLSSLVQLATVSQALPSPPRRKKKVRKKLSH